MQVHGMYCLMCIVYIYLSIFIDVPKPKVLGSPRSLNITDGSTAVFTCNFETATDNEIAQVHWLFNGNDLAGCNRFNNSINCIVTQQSTYKNYISSNLTIYSVQTNNAGQYTCYCSYNTSLPNVNGVHVIKSDHKSATLVVLDSGTNIISVVFKFLNKKLH